MFFDFVRQRAAYEMRISGWRSDVCSADLSAVAGRIERPGATWLAGQRAKYSIAAADHRERKPWCQFVKGVGELIGPMRVSCTHQWPQYPQSTGGDERYRSVTTRRSEEHTSELQSLMRISYAVFCLKKKNKQT